MITQRLDDIDQFNADMEAVDVAYEAKFGPVPKPSTIQTAKQSFLQYKAAGGEMDSLEWCYENEPELFAHWQNEGQVSGDWIYYEI